MYWHFQYLTITWLFVALSFPKYSHENTFIEDLTLNAQEKRALDEFKELIFSSMDLPHEYMKEDVYLIRWLRARNFNLQMAKTMLLENLKWREKNKMDTVHSEDWSYYWKNFPYSLEGKDRQGRPILYVHIGPMDFRHEVVSGKLDRLMRWNYKAFDEAAMTVRELGNKYHNVSQGIVILNIQGFNLVQHGCLRCIPAILSLLTTYENYYPGLADNIFLINLPAAAETLLLAPARNLIHPETNRILVGFGTNRNIWLKELLKLIDLSELPPALGGSKMFNIPVDNYDY